jgi:signal transduction histidine kinase
LKAHHADTPEESLERLRDAVAQLRASRERLVLAADADRQRIERELHEGVQQHLVALAVNLQLLGQLVDADPAAAKRLIEDMGTVVQEAMDETARLAQRIYPSLETGGLAAALRAAVESAGIPASVDVTTGPRCPPAIARTVYLCCLEALEHAGAGTTLTVRDERDAVTFEVAVKNARAREPAGSDAGIDRLRERVEALGGRLTIHAESGRVTRVSGCLPSRADVSCSPPGRGSRP